MKNDAPEGLLDGFEPDFEFEPADCIPVDEFADRIMRLRREATIAGHDVLLVHTSGVGYFSTSNNYLRYACDWAREGLLIIPTDAEYGLQLLSFYTEAALVPPPGEPVGVEAIWQVGPVGREFSGRPGDPEANLVRECAKILSDLGYSAGSIGVIGDKNSSKTWQTLAADLRHARFHDETGVIQRMQRLRSPNEVAQIRTAAQLIDIGYQAACHVTRVGVSDFAIYAAFTFAQMARGGEYGDGYQIGINQWGTHCGKPYGRIVRPGDLINHYISAVTYHGYSAQTARMMAVGEITDRQEATLAMCTEAVRRAEALIRPGVRFCDLHDAAFSVYVEQGYLQDTATRSMPWNWSPMDDGSARRVPEYYIFDEDYERTGRRLDHIYPAAPGPHNPNLGHSIGMIGSPKFNITSHNTDVAEPGMTFVLHAQWLDAMSSGANIGDCYVVTDTGYENLSCHTPLDTFRISVK
jgi:Xaa-Pro aminopeptidase